MQKSYITEDYIIIYITVPSVEEGRKIAAALVEERLAACVSIIPQIISTYRWKEKIEEYKETQLMVKTDSRLFDEIVELVKKLHTFTLPEIISIRIDKGTPDYLMWMSDELK